MVKKKRKMHTGKKARQNKRTIVLTGIAAASALVFVIVMGIWMVISGKGDGSSQEAAIFESSTSEPGKTQISEYINDNVVGNIVNAGKMVTDSLKERPATVDMTAENQSTFATIGSCLIEDASNVVVSVTSEGIPSSDDKYYYLFEEACYEDGITEESQPIAKVYKSEETSFKVALNKGAADTRLFSKFAVGVKLDGKYVTISHAQYITNPGGCAGYSYGGMAHDSIKGILPDPLRIGELQDLGVNYCVAVSLLNFS